MWGSTSGATRTVVTRTRTARRCAATTDCCGASRCPAVSRSFWSNTTPGEYLHHRSQLGEFFLGSDSVIPTYTGYLAMTHILDQLGPGEHEQFLAVGYTIGGMMIFPSNRVDGRQTLNGARGFHPRIADRMDLTLECIRRHYAAAQPNPLKDVLQRYSPFFDLFHDFAGYVDHFLLQDLLESQGDAVKFFMPFEEFTTSATPSDLESYREYRRRSIDFVQARNVRIAAWARENLSPEPGGVAS